MNSKQFKVVMFFSGVGAIFFLSLPSYLFLLAPSAKEVPLLHDLINDFFPKVGEALGIAVFLALTVDLFVKRRLADEVVKDVTPFILGYALPAEIKNELRAIYAIDQYRTATIHIILQELQPPTEPAFVEVNAYVEYSLFNLTEDYLKHEHIVFVQQAYKPQKPIQHILATKATGVSSLEALNTSNSGDYDKKAESDDLGNSEGDYRVFRKSSFIPPHGVGRFESMVHYVLPADHEETFVSVLATVKVDVKVEYPKDMSVMVVFGHREGSKVKPCPVPYRPPTWPLTEEVWEFKGALLPYQPIIIGWRKHPTPPPASKQGG
jgi:hypothetical protein